MSKQSHPPSMPPSEWAFVGLGFAWTVAGVAVAGMTRLQLFNLWVKSQSVQPDFSDNGLNWMSIFMVAFIPALDTLFFVVTFLILVPFVYSVHILQKQTPIRVAPLIIGPALIVVIVHGYIIGVGGTHLLFPLTTAPTLVVLVSGLWFFLRKANSYLPHPR